ncbi:MAG TPA: hypothetical protein VL992_08745 [Tepidisphaeraceae bacterium]|nr:hypothetical protein [Tepidisphaeraceae bacterium]
MAFQLVQIFYWLALATWFGGTLFVAMAFRIIFKTVQENNPILPQVLSVNLEGQHGTLLAGTIMGNILSNFMRVELGCSAVLFLTLIAQALMVDLHSQDDTLPLVFKTILLIAASGVVIFDWLLVWPRMWSYRQKFLDHADEPETANPAKDQFDRYQRQSVMLLEVLLFLLLGMVLFSGGTATLPSHPLTPATHLESDHAPGQS